MARIVGLPTLMVAAACAGLLTGGFAASPVAADNTPAVQSGGFTLDAKVDPGHVRPGHQVVVRAMVKADQAVDNRHVDVEVLDANNRKVAQKIFSGQSFKPGETRRYEWKWRAPEDLAAGEYTVKVGVFTQDWKQIAAWDNAAAKLRVGEERKADANGEPRRGPRAKGEARRARGQDNTPAVTDGNYTLDARTRPRGLKPGEEITIDAMVTANAPEQKRRVDIEILDANNKKIAQKIYNDQDFSGGETKRYTWKWEAPRDLAAGEYTVKVGVFSEDWKKLAAWDNRAADFRISQR